MVINGLIGAITLDAFCTLDSTHILYMTSFPTVLTLWNFRVHIGTTNCGNKAANVEPSVDKGPCFHTTLGIPNIDLYDGHVRFWGYFDNSWFQSQNNVVEDVCVFENFFYVFRSDLNISLF